MSTQANKENEEYKSTTSWTIPAAITIPMLAESFTQEEMDAWEITKRGTFDWLYDFNVEEDSTEQFLWKRHVAYLRKMMIENVDLALYDFAEAVRKGKWPEQPLLLHLSEIISLPIPTSSDIEHEKAYVTDVVDMDE